MIPFDCSLKRSYRTSNDRNAWHRLAFYNVVAWKPVLFLGTGYLTGIVRCYFLSKILCIRKILLYCQITGFTVALWSKKKAKKNGES